MRWKVNQLNDVNYNNLQLIISVWCFFLSVQWLLKVFERWYISECSCCPSLWWVFSCDLTVCVIISTYWVTISKKNSNFNQKIRAGSHSRQFCRKLITLGSKICQLICFLMRPLICDFQKFQNREKTPKTPVCLGGADQFFQISKNQGSPPLKLSTVEKSDSRHRLQGHEREKEREISLFTLMFLVRAVRSYSMDRDFPFPNYGHKMPRSEQYSFLQGLGNTPPIWPVVSAEQRKPESHCYTFRPHGKCRDCTQFHRSNFPCVIDDACTFTCWNATVWGQFYFHFRSDAICFFSRFFQAKIKICLWWDPALR